jgi:FkbM family methyltransferase
MKKRDNYRSLLRRIVPKQVYHWGADLLNAFHIIKTNGLHTYLQLYNPSQKHMNEVAVIRLRNYSHPIYYRPNTSDINTLVQNLIREEYGQLPTGFQPAWIIDAGGYIGDVSLYFLNQFPNAHVICLEPDPKNYVLAVRNLESFSDRVTLLPKGLWSHPTKLSMAGAYVGTQLSDRITGDEFAIEVCDMATLIEELQIDQIDILKLDIEGAEDHVLNKESETWLPKVKLIIVEFHGAVRRERGIEHLRQNGFVGYQYRSLHYFVNQRL